MVNGAHRRVVVCGRRRLGEWETAHPGVHGRPRIQGSGRGVFQMGQKDKKLVEK